MGIDPLAKFKIKTEKKEENKPTPKTDPLAKFKPSETTNNPTIQPIEKQPKPNLSPNVRRLIEDEVEVPLQAQKQTTQTTKTGKKVTPQAKIAPKDLKRPDNPFAPLLVNALNTASLGLFERNTDAIDQLREKSPIQSTIGSMAGYLAPFGIAKGALVKGGQTLGKRILTDAALGAGVDTASELVKGKNDLGTAAKNVATGAALGIVADGALTGLGKFAKYISKLEKIPAQEVSATIDNAKSTTIKSQGQYKVKNTALDKAINEYNSAIETIQNHFETNELRADEMARIKHELGIDLDSIVKKIEDAGKGVSVSDIGKNTNLARAAGVKSLPNIKPIETPKPLNTINPQPIQNNALKTNVGAQEIAATSTIDTKSKILLENPSKTSNIGNTIRKSYQSIVSQKYPLESIGRTGGEAAEKVAKLGANINQTSGTVDYILGKELVDMQGNNVGKSMFDSLSGLNANQRQEFFDYMLNKHNVARMSQEKPVFGADVTADISTQKVAQYEAANPQFKEYANNVRQYIDNLVNEWGVESGLVDENLFKQLKEIYPDYIPTYRDTTKSLSGNKLKNVSVGKVIKKATGSESPILPLDQQIAAMTNRIVRAGRQNELYNALYDAVQENPQALSSFARLVDKGGIADDLAQNIAEEGADGLAKSMDKALEKVGDVYQLRLYRQGKPVTMEISENMYSALKSFNELTDIDKVVNMARKYASGPMKALITGYNPLFALKNLTRDLPTAFINSVDGAKWLKNLPNAITEMASNGQHWKDYQALGGVRAGLFNYDKGVKVPYQGSLDIKGMAKKGLDKVFAFNTFTETWPRFAEYLATVEKMGNTYDAKIAGIYNAAEVSTNFARSGNVGKTADAFVPYLNPAIQGIDKFARQIVYKPLQTIGKGVAVLTVPTIILDQLNKNDENYKNLSAREKDNYYHVSNGDGTFTRIPKSRENAVLFSTLVEWVARRSRGEKIGPNDMLSTIRTNFSPGDPVESFVLTPLLRFSSQVQNPKQEVRNFAGTPIVPTALRKYEPRYQYDNSTTEFAKFVGDKLNVSPKALDYLIKSYSGVIGQVMQPATAGNQGLIKKTFTADPAYQTDTLNKFYDIIDNIETKANTKNLVEKIPSKTVTADEKMLSAMRKVSTQISDLRKAQKLIEGGNLSKEEKAKKMRDLQLQMLELANKAINQYEGR